MTYHAYDGSVHDGEPVELYAFSVAGQGFTYTSSDSPFTSQGTAYEPIAITRSAVSQSADRDADMTVRVPRDNPFALLYRVIVPFTRATLTVYRQHRGDPDSERIVLWKGRVRAVSWEVNEAVLTCEPMTSALKRIGLRRSFSSQCGFILYDTATCKVVAGNFAVDVPVGGVSGGTGTRLTSSVFGTFPDHYFTGGYLERSAIDRRMIVGHVGSEVDVVIPFEVLDATDTLTAYPGCAHTTSDCENKFSNIANYGGWPYIPTRNPFDSGI